MKTADCDVVIEFETALIAGGHSERMGLDKVLLPVAGRTLIEYQLEKLRLLQSKTLFVSCRRSQALPIGDAIPVFDETEGLGPLEGIRGCLEVLRADMLLVLAVDLPKMTPGYLKGLLKQCTSLCGVVPEINSQYQPLSAVYPKATLELAIKTMTTSDHSLQAFVRTVVAAGLVSIVPVSVEEAKLFDNWNTPKDVFCGGDLTPKNRTLLKYSSDPIERTEGNEKESIQ